MYSASLTGDIHNKTAFCYNDARYEAHTPAERTGSWPPSSLRSRPAPRLELDILQRPYQVLVLERVRARGELLQKALSPRVGPAVVELNLVGQTLSLAGVLTEGQSGEVREGQVTDSRGMRDSSGGDQRGHVTESRGRDRSGGGHRGSGHRQQGGGTGVGEVREGSGHRQHGRGCTSLDRH